MITALRARYHNSTPCLEGAVLLLSTCNNTREKLFKFFTMPQLLPFYFVNQLTFALLVLITMIYVFSKYILPMFTELFLTRMYITKL